VALLRLSFAISLAAFGCASAPVPVQKMALDAEFLIRVNDEVRTVNADQLFAQARQELDDAAYQDCARNFDTLWQNLPGSEYEIASIYNAGLCHEQLANWELAAERYLRLLALQANSRDALDATFRLAECDANSSNWERVATHMQRLLEREDLRHLDKTEASYRLGMAQIALGQYDDAEQSFRASLKRNRLAGTARIANTHYFVSGAYYGIALAYHLRFSRIRFRLPEERMKEDLEVKRSLAKSAYSAYIDTVNQRNHFWGILSGYMVGKLFEDFYYDLLTAEVPPELEGEELRDYFLALREDFRPLLDEALIAYETTAKTSVRLGIENEWATASDERLQRLRQYMDDESALRQEEQAIAEWSRQVREIEESRAQSPNSELLVPPPPPPMPVAKAAAPAQSH
jgi:TolA-binding protein